MGLAKTGCLTALVEKIVTTFPFVTDLPRDISLRDVSSSRHPLHLSIRDIISGDTWVENMHSSPLIPTGLVQQVLDSFSPLDSPSKSSDLGAGAPPNPIRPPRSEGVN